jgi:hypothetical protein
MKLKASLVTFVLIGLIVFPVQADIVPNEPDPTPDQSPARKAVQDRLDTLGVDPADAKQIAESLRIDEAEFFARSRNANAVVAGLWIEEWIGAALYIAFVGPHIYKYWYRYMFLDEREW